MKTKFYQKIQFLKSVFSKWVYKREVSGRKSPRDTWTRDKANHCDFRHKELNEPGLFEGWRQEHGKFQDSLGYTARPHLKKVKTEQKNRLSRYPSQDSWVPISLTLHPHTTCRHTDP